jgi:hypothetical protein
MRDVRSEQGDDRCFRTYTTELIGYGEAAEQSLPVWMTPTKNAKVAHERRVLGRRKRIYSEVSLMPSKKRDGAFFEGEKFLKGLGELIDALPSDAETQRIVVELETLIQFLSDLKARLQSLPTHQDAGAARTAVDTLTELFIQAKSNPVVGAAIGIKAAGPRQKQPMITSEDVERAKSAITQFDSLPIDEVRAALEAMSTRDLQGVADSIGIRTARTARETLVHQVATKITNTRGYRSLRDGASEP